MIVYNTTIYYFSWDSINYNEIIMEICNNPIIQKLVIFGPQEHEPLELYQRPDHHIMFETFLKYRGIKLFIVVNPTIDNLKNPNYKFINRTDVGTWETFFAFSLLYDCITGETCEPMGHSDIEALFISLNRRPHPHRCFFMDMLAKHELLETGIVTWHEYENSASYDFKFWKTRSIKTLPNDPISDLMGSKQFRLYHPPAEFSKSLFSIVCESTPNILFVTEKTFMPIYHKRPFLVAGAKNFHSYLKSMGFRLFDEIIDYSFDELDKYEDRVDALMEQVVELCKRDPNEMLDILKPKLSHNIQNLLNIVKYRRGIDDSVIKIAKKVSKFAPKYNYYNKLINFSSTKEFEIAYNKILKGL